MRRLRKLLVVVAVLAMLMSFTVPALAATDYAVHVCAPSEWTEPGLWAWSSPDGTNAFSAWPGEKLIKDELNEGWFIYTVPSWVNSIIINEGVDGGAQTVDVGIESRELWITVTGANLDGKYEASVVYEAPEGFQFAAATQEAEAPKTGEASFAYLWVSLSALSAAGCIYIRRRKLAKV